jgi:hypothetical protein
MYGDDMHGMRKNNLYDEIRDFLETHKISELLEIVTDCIEYEKGEYYV